MRPNNSANLALPPALSISRDDSFAFMSRNGTRGVYQKSNESFTKEVNTTFRIDPMSDDSITIRALALAKDLKGWNQKEFADAMGIDKQLITNWKKRGWPPARYASTAALLGITVEEFITGRKPAHEEPSAQSTHGFWPSREGAQVGAEWDKIQDEAVKTFIQNVIFGHVGAQVRNETPPPLTPVPRTSIRPSGASSARSTRGQRPAHKQHKRPQ